MQLTKAEVDHIAKLARLALSPQEVERFTKELGDILTYVAQLQEVDTEGVSPTSQVTGLSNVMREDRVEMWCTGDELLRCSALPVADRQIRVLPVIVS